MVDLGVDSGAAGRHRGGRDVSAADDRPRFTDSDPTRCRPALGDDFVWRCERCSEFIDAAVLFPGDGHPVILPPCPDAV